MSIRKALRGVKVHHYKNTAGRAIESLPVPEFVSLPMQQHMGPPCDVIVAVGDEVKVGQVIGDSTSFVTAPIHSSVSGKVVRIEDYISPMGMISKAVVIETDGNQDMHPELAPPVVNGYAEFLAAVRASGLVGLGGAGFPTHVKLKPPKLEQVDTLIINAAECEPYITTDHYAGLNNSDLLKAGIESIIKFLELSDVVIGVEDNKPDMIAHLKQCFADMHNVKISTLRSKYPQGAEKVLTYETTGRIIREGTLPADVGVVIMNITSVVFLASYLKTGIPLISRAVTVDGGAVHTPKLLTVPFGTPFIKIFDFCGGFKSEPAKIIMGGPMMGITVYDLNSPLLKNNNALLAFSAKQVSNEEESACIRCGRCVRACPFNLMPRALELAYQSENIDMLKELKINTCMECGCCSYVCPAKRQLVTTNKLSKKLLREKGGKK